MLFIKGRAKKKVTMHHSFQLDFVDDSLVKTSAAPHLKKRSIQVGLKEFILHVYMNVSKNRVILPPKMDGENNGRPY